MKRFKIKASCELDVTAETKRAAKDAVQTCWFPKTQWREPEVGFLTEYTVMMKDQQPKVEEIALWNSSTDE